jgi:hypothetical protein
MVKTTTSAIQVILGVVLLPGYAAFWLWELLMMSTRTAFDDMLAALDQLDSDVEEDPSQRSAVCCTASEGAGASDTDGTPW